MSDNKILLVLLSFLPMGLIFLIGPSYATVQITPSPTEQSMLEDESILRLNITYWNGTKVIVDGTILNFAASDEIVQFIQEKIAQEVNPEKESTDEEESPEEESDGGSSDNNNEPEQEQSPSPPPQQEEEGVEEESVQEQEPEAQETNTTMRVPEVICMGPDINDPCRAMPLLST